MFGNGLCMSCKCIALSDVLVLKADQSKMRGSYEQLIKDLSELQIKQKDVLQSVESRIAKFERSKSCA